MALLRHSLRESIAEPLEAESLALTLVQRALGPRTTHAPAPASGGSGWSIARSWCWPSDLARRWTLAEIAAEVGGSPVYLTQVFQQVEGLPLYRYQLRLRLARALDLLAQYDDLTALGLDLGFSSHSHFSAAFRETYGRSPSEFRQSRAASLTPARATSLKILIAALSAAWPTALDAIRVFKEDEVMAEKTCAACDCALDANAIAVTIGGKTVEVCCDECAQKLKEAHASASRR